MKEKYSPSQQEDLIREQYRDFKKSEYIQGVSISGIIEANKEKNGLVYALRIRYGGETTPVRDRRMNIKERDNILAIKGSVIELLKKGYGVDAIIKELDLDESVE